MDNHTGQRHFPSFPLPAEGETVYSVFARCQATSGFLGDWLLKELTGQRMRSRLLGALPAYLPTMATQLHKNHPFSSPLNVVMDFSIFPYLSFFMPATSRNVFATEVASNDATHPTAMKMGLAKYPASIIAPPRFCFSCIQDQISENGFPYFRREHQLPGVFFCWRHKEVLYQGCERCGVYPLRGLSLALPGECRCNSGIKPLPAADFAGPSPKSLLWLAEQSAHLVNSSGTCFSDSSAALGQKAMAAARNRIGTIDYCSVADRVIEFFGEDALRMLNVEVKVNGEPAPWISRFFYRGRGHRATLLYLLLVGAYFNSIGDFERETADERSEKRSTPRKVANPSKLLHKHRGILLKLVAQNGELSRGEFQRAAPGSYDFLVRYDKEFFQSNVKRAKASIHPRKKRVDWDGLDNKKAAELICLFDSENEKAEKPAFITTTSALRSVKIYSQYTTDPLQFPKVTEVLSKRLEDKDSFHRRRLHWGISEMKRTGTPISANRLRRVASLPLSVLYQNREVILKVIYDVGAEVDARSFV
ncbi:TnsD family transposase [Geomonas nitrogeniifigens]|uniref:TnsD family transposase n=1 Tax=Geomonas diazotrophica TaxID=2843197 RepID=A0ABX8JJ14_9BACT|nr:TnsD family Tn7-like transposition protein [Geomonas nitrogeniifigens]QWV97282.1 TnsD family transposase [Geomonas nitrogeniifigens]